MSIQETFLQNPEYIAVVTVLVFLVFSYQHSLSYREYIYANSVKGVIFRLADPYFRKRGRPLLREKGTKEVSDEYVTSVDKSLRGVYSAFRENGFTPHLIATTKISDGQLADVQMVFVHEDGKQTEVILFNRGGTIDVYAHVETAVFDPDGHLTDGQQSGDPRGVVMRALDGL